MKDNQKHHHQQDPTTTSQQAAFYSLSCTYFPLSFEALWNFNVTLSVANGKCRILHNDLDIPYTGHGQLGKKYSLWLLLSLFIFSPCSFNHFSGIEVWSKKSSSVLYISNYSFKTITVFENFELAKFRHSETTRIACWFAVVKLGI